MVDRVGWYVARGRSLTVAARIGSRMLALSVLAALGCGEDPFAPTVNLFDYDRHARFTVDGRAVVYYHQDENRTTPTGIYRVDLASGEAQLLARATLAGLDVHPVTDSIIFSAREIDEPEPALWLMGPDGGGLRRLGGGGTEPGYRWPAFSADGTRIAWEIRYRNATGLDTAHTLWMAEWDGGAMTSSRALGPGRRSAWRPDGAALAVERRRPGGALPSVVALVDTSGQLLDTLGLGGEPRWRPDGGMVAYVAEVEPDRGCEGVCFVTPGASAPVALSASFMSFPGSWSRDATEYVYARIMRTYQIEGNPILNIEESRLWIRTLATGADRQVTF